MKDLVLTTLLVQMLVDRTDGVGAEGRARPIHRRSHLNPLRGRRNCRGQAVQREQRLQERATSDVGTNGGGVGPVSLRTIVLRGLHHLVGLTSASRRSRAVVG